MASEINVKDWKEEEAKAHARAQSDSPDGQPPRSPSSISKADEVSSSSAAAVVVVSAGPENEDGHDSSSSRVETTSGCGRRWLPRIGGLNALIHESRPSPGGETGGDGTCPFYKVYKRRWFGVVELTLLNIIVSWDWLTFSPVASSAAQFFHTSESNINWFSTAVLFSFCAVAPLVIYVLHWGPKPSIIVAAVLILVGNWVRYGGVAASRHSFGLVMFGQILIGFAQPFVLAAPTRYSDLWFTNRGRVAATALMSLANPLGAALGQLIVPFWVYSPGDIPNATLYIAIIATIGCVPALFIPARPPTPAAPSNETAKLPLSTSVRALARSPEFWMVFLPYAVYVGFFNSISSLLSQMMQPYGFDDTQSGLAGAVLIVVGLASSAVTSPLLDRTKSFLPAIKLAVPLIGACYLAFVWMPATRDIAGPYAVLAVLGASSFSLVPVAMELLVELTHPVSPEVTAVLAWAGGQLLGAVFIIVSDTLRAGQGASPPGNMDRALVFQAVVAMVIVPVPLCLGLFGRRGKVLLRRVQTDQDRLGAQGAADEEQQQQQQGDGGLV